MSYSTRYNDEFECTPAQYHAAIDKLWEALGVSGPQSQDCFTMAAQEIVRLREQSKELLEALQHIAALEHMIFGDAVGGAYMAVTFAEQAIAKATAQREES